ncbi:MAG: hypothetical protein OEV40_29185 [Acidimicrobiia bacterium]|nr:hypothetical protein [Acidimicrobiia bacterium]
MADLHFGAGQETGAHVHALRSESECGGEAATVSDTASGEIISRDLAQAGIEDPNIAGQHLTAARALRELQRIRRVTLTAGDRTIALTTRTSGHQRHIVDAIGVDTTTWPATATIT